MPKPNPDRVLANLKARLKEEEAKAVSIEKSVDLGEAFDSVMDLWNRYGWIRYLFVFSSLTLFFLFQLVLSFGDHLDFFGREFLIREAFLFSVYASVSTIVFYLLKTLGLLLFLLLPNRAEAHEDGGRSQIYWAQTKALLFELIIPAIVSVSILFFFYTSSDTSLAGDVLDWVLIAYVLLLSWRILLDLRLYVISKKSPAAKVRTAKAKRSAQKHKTTKRNWGVFSTFDISSSDKKIRHFLASLVLVIAALSIDKVADLRTKFYKERAPFCFAFASGDPYRELQLIIERADAFIIWSPESEATEWISKRDIRSVHSTDNREGCGPDQTSLVAPHS